MTAKYFRLLGQSVDFLLGWISDPANYGRWKSTSVVNGPDQRKDVSGDTKKLISQEIAELPKSKGYLNVNGKSVQNKIDEFEWS